MDDSKIIALFWDRSEEAISETDKKYGKYCYYIAKNILTNDEDAEECVNDSYLRAWNSIPPKSPERLQTYLGKIVRNLSLNKLERITVYPPECTPIDVLNLEIGDLIFVSYFGSNCDVSNCTINAEAIETG